MTVGSKTYCDRCGGEEGPFVTIALPAARGSSSFPLTYELCHTNGCVAEVRAVCMGEGAEEKMGSGGKKDGGRGSEGGA